MYNSIISKSFRIIGGCAHAIAILMLVEEWLLQGLKDVPAFPSCTSMPSQWDKPRGNKILPEPVTQMTISNPANVDRKRKPVTPIFIDNRY